MQTLILSLHVIVCVTLVILVLLQAGKEGMGVIFGGGNTFLDAEIAALVAPRRLYLEVGCADHMFDFKRAVQEFERVPRYFEALGVRGNLDFNAWDGGHKIDTSERGMDFFYAGLK